MLLILFNFAGLQCEVKDAKCFHNE